MIKHNKKLCHPIKKQKHKLILIYIYLRKCMIDIKTIYKMRKKNTRK